VKVLLVDDHSLFLEGLQNLLTIHKIHVVGTARDGLEALEKTRLLAPDIILMDVRMPRYDGLAATRLIKAEHPGCKIVMLTTSTEDEDLFEAIKSGADGYLLKSLEVEPFIAYLNGVLRGEAAISPEMATTLFREFSRQAAQIDVSGKSPVNVPAVQSLTPRQLQVLELVTRGLSYREVGSQLNLSEHTVKYHMSEILQILHLKNREQVVAYALRMGLIKPSRDMPA
jgi:DNA-binding NarL/FixJ family response regulator